MRPYLLEDCSVSVLQKPRELPNDYAETDSVCKIHNLGSSSRHRFLMCVVSVQFVLVARVMTHE